MKLDVRERVLIVAMAEAACLQAHVGRVDAVRELKGEFQRVATPLRIVGGGFALGAFAGLMPVRTKTEKVGPLGSLLQMAMDTVLPSLMAGITAGQTAAETAGEEVEAATETIADDVAEQVVEEVTVQEPARGRRKRS